MLLFYVKSHGVLVIGIVAVISSRTLVVANKNNEVSITIVLKIYLKYLKRILGKLQEQINFAKGNYERVVKEAESHKVSLELEADGLKEQINTLSSSLNGNTDEAIKMLLEIKRMEQFKAIATGQNNTVYFSQDKNLTNSYMTDFLEKTKSK